MNRQDQFDLYFQLPNHVYVLEKGSHTGILPEAHPIHKPQDITSTLGKYHYLVCGDVGFPSGGNITVWWIQTAGPIVKYIRERTRDPEAKSLVGFAVLRDEGAEAVKRRCTVQFSVSLLCITPFYRRQQHGAALWSRIEQHLLLVATTVGGPYAQHCDVIDRIDLSLDATIDFTDLDAFIEWEQTRPEQEKKEEPLGVRGLRKWSGGGWKFWERQGFEPRALVMGTLRMRKSLQVPRLFEVTPSGLQQKAAAARRQPNRRPLT